MEQTQENNQKPSTNNSPSTNGGLMKNKKIVSWGILLLVLGIIVGGYYYHKATNHETTDDAFIDGHVVQISPRAAGHIYKVYVSDNQWVKEGDLLAEIDPKDYQIALSQASAGLQVVNSQLVGAKVNVGLTDITSNALVEQASADLKQAKSNIQTMQAQVNGAESKMVEANAQITTAWANAEAAKSQVNSAQSDATQAEADAKRAEQLFKDGVITQQDKEHAATDAKNRKSDLETARKRAMASDNQLIQAQAALKTAKEFYNQLKSQLQESQAMVSKAQGHLKETDVTPQKMSVSKSQLETTISELDYMKAGLDKAALQLSYTKIYAPIAGRVTQKAIELGNFVQIGQPIMAIVSKEVWVTANFKETQLTHIHPGQKVDIKIDTYPGKWFKGHIDSIQFGTGGRFSLFPPENATGNYVKVVQRVPVKIVFDEEIDSKYSLAPGMSVVPEVYLK